MRSTDRPADLTVGIHLCRGNFRSTWFAEGGYEPVAEVLFGELDVDAYFLEYDDERSGDFAPLRFVPADKTVVLGLISSKVAELESIDELAERVDEAAKYVPMDQLCLSPQCGFAAPCTATTSPQDVQWAKLRLTRRRRRPHLALIRSTWPPRPPDLGWRSGQSGNWGGTS